VTGDEPTEARILTPLSDILAALRPGADGLTAAIGDDWRQGRTLYGGLSAALCVEAAARALPEPRPLRSAQFAFAGPASGTVTARATVLRQGKSTTFASAELHGEAGLATQALLCFAAPRPSALVHAGLPMPAVPAPDACPNFFADGLAPAFAQHFEARRAGGAMPVSGSDAPELLLWLRHRDAGLRQDATSLVALGDAAPPAAMTMFTARAPISTMTWSVDMLADGAAQAPGAWLLMRSAALAVAGGYSVQAMNLWDESGRAVMTGSQCVAVFA
jgi:acyl-CoA thioesterase